MDLKASPDGPAHLINATEVIDRYAELHAAFHWQVPADFNIAQACCARWARDTPDAVAIREVADLSVASAPRPDTRCHTYADLQHAANRLANVLRERGVARGDRVAIVMPQRFESAVAHIAIYQLGAVAMPLSMLFGPEALEYRINDSGARLAIVDASSVANVRAVRAQCAGLIDVLAVGTAQGQGDLDWDAALASASSCFTLALANDAHTADAAAVLIYTSGTTGAPKGALIPHRALLGNLSGFVASQNGFGTVPSATSGAAGDTSTPAPPNVFWSPADWAWTGGLMDALLPTLYFGSEIVAYAGRFSAESAFELMQRHRVTHTFLFPTALKVMMKALPAPREHYDLHLRAVMSAGEAVGDAVFAWCRDALGVPVNEMFGQTELNYIVGNSALQWPARPGSMGRAYPGHRVAVIDAAGIECVRGTPGDVALHRLDRHGHPDPVFFLGYWNNAAATLAKFTGDAAHSWCRTGDMAVMDEAGYLWYHGRADDMFKAAGYRIGPSEIENCLVRHPAVANAAVVPKPDAQRGAVVKAYVVLAPGFVASTELALALQQHVRGLLAPYEYPKEIEFIAALPMTTTGKVQRRVLRLREEQLHAARASLAPPDAPGTGPAPTARR